MGAISGVSRRAFLAGVTGSALVPANAMPDAVFSSSVLAAGHGGGVQCGGPVSIFDFLDDESRKAVFRNDYSKLRGVSTAVQRAINAARGRVVTFGSCIFRLEAPVWLTEECHLDLAEGRFEVAGNTLGFVSKPAAAPSKFVVEDGANFGSRTLVLDNVVGIQLGQWGYLRGDSPEGNRNSVPPAWGQVERIRGKEVTFDRALPLDYRGNCQLIIVPDLDRRFSLRNGVVDGSLNRQDQATGQGVRVTGAESVVIENVEFTHFQQGGALTSAIEVFECLDISIRHCSFKYGLSANNMVDVQTARHVEFLGNHIVGDHFGVNLTRADYGKAIGNTVVGRRKRSADLGMTMKNSVRGIKFYGCGHALVSQNHCADFESPIKIEACTRFLVDCNYVINSGLDDMTGQIALNIGSTNVGSDMHSGVVTGNIVENCGGTGIGITSDVVGRVVVANNVVRRVGAHGIYIAVDGCTVTGNQISDWDLLGRNYAGVYSPSSGGQIIKNNVFGNGYSREAPCTDIRGLNSLVSDNLCMTKNPIAAHSV